MKAVIYENYGEPEVLEIKEFEKPIPKDNEVLIKVFSTSVTSADCLMRKAVSFVDKLFLGFTKPRKKILGTELSGEIENVGKNVKRFQKGDNILIIGASGSLGSYAVQLAKYFGANGTGVCGTSNIEVVKNLGADKVIDYKKQDFADSTEKFDIIFDTSSKSTYSKYKELLKPNGKYLVTLLNLKSLFLTLWTKLFSRKKVIFAMSINKTKSLEFIKDLVERNQLKPIIDKIFKFNKIVEAHKYAEKKENAGNVAITQRTS